MDSSDKKYLLLITADTNDADYVTSKHWIEPEKFNKFTPLIQAIKDFKPYAGRTYSWGAYTCDHNWAIGECLRRDLGEKSPKEIYHDIDESIIEEFEELLPYGEYGIHTIESINIYTVTGIQELL